MGLTGTSFSLLPPRSIIATLHILLLRWFLRGYQSSFPSSPSSPRGLLRLSREIIHQAWRVNCQTKRRRAIRHRWCTNWSVHVWLKLKKKKKKRNVSVSFSVCFLSRPVSYIYPLMGLCPDYHESCRMLFTLHVDEARWSRLCLVFCVIAGPLWILLLVLLWWKQEEMKTKPSTWERAKQLRGVFALLTPSTEIQQSSRITQRLRRHLSSITRSPTCLHKRLHKIKCLWKLKSLLQTHWAP